MVVWNCYVSGSLLIICVCVCVCVCERERERERLCVDEGGVRVCACDYGYFQHQQFGCCDAYMCADL